LAVWIPYLELNCNKCSDGQKVIYGCEKETLHKDWWEVSGYKFNRCPLKVIDARIYEYFSAYNKFQKVTYSGACDWVSEPAKLHDVFDLIEKERVTIEEKKKLGNKR